MTDANRDRRRPKEELAAGERSARGYEETYGRASGERFREEFPRSYPPGGLGDWRRAMRAYVRGHDRGWDADRKYAEADREREAPAPARQEEPRRTPERDVDSVEAEEATGETEEGTVFGVPVPTRLDFHRGASIWRDRLPRLARMPRHGGRDPSGSSLRGG